MEEEKKLALEEEQKELDVTKALKEEEVRENIINEYGFNEDDDADKIDKLVAKELESSKKLSDAIGQKIKQREKVDELQKQLDKKDPPKPEPEANAEDLGKTIDEKLDERLEKREIDSLDYPDELKDEIQRVAKIGNISIKEALKDPYIVSKVEAHKEENKADEASISRTNNKASDKAISFDNPPDCDMNTEEGRKEWEDYKRAEMAKGN